MTRHTSQMMAHLMLCMLPAQGVLGAALFQEPIGARWLLGVVLVTTGLCLISAAAATAPKSSGCGAAGVLPPAARRFSTPAPRARGEPPRTRGRSKFEE
jgi:drug/metabolite transporter (DMT)-like permease